jgi:hypothetical protein
MSTMDGFMRALLFIATLAASCRAHPVDANKTGKPVVETATDKLRSSDSEIVETSPAAANLANSDQARLDAAAYSRGFSVGPIARNGVPEIGALAR